VIAASEANVGFPLLTMLVIMPMIGSIIVALLSRRRAEWVKLTALVTSVFVAALSIWMVVEFPSGSEGFEFVSKHSWIESWGISWHLGVDGISLFLVLLTGVLFPLVIAGVDPHHDEKPYLAWILMLEAGVMGSFLSLSVAGVTTTVCVRRRSSSSTRWPARPSCWWGSWPPLSSLAMTSAD